MGVVKVVVPVPGARAYRVAPAASACCGGGGGHTRLLLLHQHVCNTSTTTTAHIRAIVYLCMQEFSSQDIG